MVTHSSKWELGLKQALSRRDAELHAVDYLEVEELMASDAVGAWLVRVHFLIPDDKPSQLSKVGTEHVKVTPIIEISQTVLKVEHVMPSPQSPETALDVMVKEPFEIKPVHSFYQLRLEGLNFMDPNLNGGAFSLRSGKQTIIDPQDKAEIEKEPVPPIAIDYLGRDFEAYRRQMLERLTTTLPDWQARSPADPGIVLVELLAHAADIHSYHQDAVATESYLDTARRRISIRRHARLLDYYLGEGSNARCWVSFKMEGPPLNLPQGTQLLTRSDIIHDVVVLEESMAYERMISEGVRVFETMHEARFYESHNQIRIYCWEEREFALKKGAVSAVLIGECPHIEEGSPLLFEQYADPETLRRKDIDPRLRHVVRVKLRKDLPSPVTDGTPLTFVEWHGDDALPFHLPVRAKSGHVLAVVRANLVLADHGGGRKPITLSPVESGPRWRPNLPQANITYRVIYDHNDAVDQPARSALHPDLRRASPDIAITEIDPLGHEVKPDWKVKRDLLASKPGDRHFVVETESDRTAILRFGDGHNGWAPDEGHTFKATYRTGSGLEGNVGVDAITHVVLPKDKRDMEDQFIRVTNPLPAEGGLNPERLERARLAAPYVYKVQARCITEEDYGRRAAAHGEVQQAVAKRVWTGSRYTLFLFVDRMGGKQVTPAFVKRLEDWIRPVRMMGDTIHISPPELVALEIRLAVLTLPDYPTNVVHARLTADLGTGYREDGQPAFFHPDRLTFGQAVSIAEILGEITQSPGVAQVTPHVFQRMDCPGNQALRQGRIDIGPTEIASVSNDPNAPELGHLTIITT